MVAALQQGSEVLKLNLSRVNLKPEESELEGRTEAEKVAKDSQQVGHNTPHESFGFSFVSGHWCDNGLLTVLAQLRRRQERQH